MSLKDAISTDINNVFLNTSEFAEEMTVIYDGTTYTGVRVALTGLDETKLKLPKQNNVEGLYEVDAVAFFKLGTVGAGQPEKGTKIKFGEPVSSGRLYLRVFRIARSTEQMGMVRLELEAIDE